MSRYFGALPGIPEGTTFISRQELREARVHLPTQAGISGSGKEGADSIVLSGGYEDDSDQGHLIIYTGEGGRDLSTGHQNAHQQLVRGNLALAVNHQTGLPVRVTRGSRHRSPYSPPTGDQYAGLYQVEDHWRDVGKSGYLIWRFRLTKLGEPQLQSGAAEAEEVVRKAVITQRPALLKLFIITAVKCAERH